MAAIIRAETKSTPSQLHMPLWLDDFCEYLRLTYNCPRKKFHVPLSATPLCPDMTLWLNLFTLDPNHPKPAKSGDPLVALLPGSTTESITITEDKIHAPQITSLQMALGMVMAAMANEGMRLKGVKLEGSPDEIAMLYVACKLLDLKVDDSNVDPALVAKHQPGMDAAWKTLQSEMNQGAQQFVSDKVTQLQSNILQNAITPDVKNLLGSVDEQKYTAAKAKIWQDQTVSPQKLMTDFGVSAAEAGNMLSAMKKENLVDETAPGQFHVTINLYAQWNPA